VNTARLSVKTIYLDPQELGNLRHLSSLDSHEWIPTTHRIIPGATYDFAVSVVAERGLLRLAHISWVLRRKSSIGILVSSFDPKKNPD
jgi:hypothetical protein